MQEEELPVAKIIIMGDYGVGKTSIAKRLVGKGFDRFYKRTIGVDFRIKQLPITGKNFEIPVKWVVWDLAGDWNFENVTADFFMGAEGGFFVYDIPRPETLETLWSWGERLMDVFDECPPVVLVGNKKDWRGKTDTCVAKETGEEYSRKLQDLLKTDFEIPYIETSAKTNENVKKAFHSLVELYKQVKGTPSQN